jgi:hypothetical protein
MRGTSDNSATRPTSNKTFYTMTVYYRLSNYTATRKMPAESSCQRAYKKLALAPLLFIN